MKGLLIFFFCGIEFFVYCQENFSGIYLGKINGDPAQIELKQSGTKISGTYTETGNTYDLKANVVAGRMIGELLISGTGMQLATFEAQKNELGLHLDLLLLGVTKVSADFTRTEMEQSNSNQPTPSKADQFNTSTLVPPQDRLTRDPAVIGHWIKEEIINSGIGDQGASLVIAYFLNFQPDGTFIQEKSSGSGGSNWSSVNQKTIDVKGYWYTRDKVMYVKPEGEKEYVRLNRYLFHEGALVFKTEGGKYLIWNKR